MRRMQCQYCQQNCQKAGKQANQVQKYYCCRCHKYQQAAYQYTACQPNTAKRVVAHLKECCGIRSTARLLAIRPNTVMTIIRREAAKVKPPVFEQGHDYQVDELCTFVATKQNEIWVIYGGSS